MWRTRSCPLIRETSYPSSRRRRKSSPRARGAGAIEDHLVLDVDAVAGGERALVLVVVSAAEADGGLVGVADRLAGVGELDDLLVGDRLLRPLVRARVDEDVDGAVLVLVSVDDVGLGGCHWSAF